MAGQVSPDTAGLRHVALVHSTAEEFAAEVLGFIADGIDAGEPVLVAASGPSLRQLRARLDGYGERVTWSDLPSPAEAGVNPGRVLSTVRAFAAAHSGRPVRCVQELAWPSRPGPHLREAIRHEALLNRALAGHRAVVMCGYDQRIGPDVLASAERTHSHLIRNGRWEHSAVWADGQVAAPEEADLPAPPEGAPVLSYRDDQTGVRRFVTGYAAGTPLPPARITDLVLAVGELAGNTLVHTTGPGTVTIWHDDTELVCQVRDTGHIADPLAGTLCPDPADPVRGRGLWVVHQVCDLVQIRTGPAGTTIRVHMHYGETGGETGLSQEGLPAAGGNHRSELFGVL